MVTACPQTAHLLQGLSTLLMATEGETGLGENVSASQMLCVHALCPRIVVGGLVSAQAKIAEREQVRGIRVARLECLQAACEEQCVFSKAVVEMVVYKLAQLGIDAWRG